MLNKGQQIRVRHGVFLAALGILALILAFFQTVPPADALPAIEGKGFTFPLEMGQGTGQGEAYLSSRTVLDRRIFGNYGDLNYIIDTMLLDEDWQEWLIFQRSPYRAIPLQAIKEIIRMAKAPQDGPVQYPGPTLEDLVFRGVVGYMLLGRPRQRVGNIEFGLTKVAPIKDERKASDPLDWLTRGDGLLSGQPWSAGNFAFRIFTIAGLVVFVLIFIEFMRMLVIFGTRVLGGKGRVSDRL